LDGEIEPPKPPVFILEGHDVGIFDTVAQAEVQLEAIDVRNGIYEGFDARGRRLNISPEGQRAAIRLAEEAPTDIASLERKLRDYLVHMGETQASGSGVELRELVELSRRYVVFSPLPLKETAHLIRGRYKDAFKAEGGDLRVKAVKVSDLRSRTKSWELYAEVEWDKSRIHEHSHAAVFERRWFSWRWERVRTLQEAKELTEAWLKTTVERGDDFLNSPASG